MSNYIKKAAAHARLLKLASAARLIRRQRALQKYAQAVQMQKRALSAGADAAIGAGLGGLLGGGIGYGLGKKDKKLLSTLIGAGAGAGIGGLGGYGLGKYLNGKKAPSNPVHPDAWQLQPPGVRAAILADNSDLDLAEATDVVAAGENGLPAGSDELIDQYAMGRTMDEIPDDQLVSFFRAATQDDASARAMAGNVIRQRYPQSAGAKMRELNL